MSFVRLIAIFIGEMRGAISEYYMMTYRELMISIIGYRSAKAQASKMAWMRAELIGMYTISPYVKRADRRGMFDDLRRKIRGSEGKGVKGRLSDEELAAIRDERKRLFDGKK